MMAAIRFHSEYYSYTGDKYRIEIWDKEYSGSSTAFNSADDGFTLSYESESQDPQSPVLGTSCEISMYIENATHEAFITDILQSPEGRFLVRILFTASNLKFWHGVVLPDIGSYAEAPYPFVFKIKSTDGIASLKDIDYNNDGVEYTGKETMLAHLLKSLNKLPFVDTFFDSDDSFIVSYLDWWEDSHTHTSGSTCALAQTYIDHAAFITYDKSTPNFISCYDVLRNITGIIGARITMANGAFWVEQISYRNASTIIGRSYTKTGTFISAGNFSGANIINQTTGGALEYGSVYEFYPGILRHEHTFKSLLRRNFLSGVSEFNNTSYLPVTVNKPIDSNGNNTTLRITGNIILNIASNTAPGSPIPPFVAIFRIRLKIGSIYLRRPISVTPGYQINYPYANWSTPPDYAYFGFPISNGFLLGNSTGAVFTFTQLLDFMTPGVTESASNFDFGFSLAELRGYDGASIDPADFDISYSFDNQAMHVYSYGGPVNTEDEQLFTCNNTINEDNSVVTKSEYIVGTATDPNTVGALWTNNGSDYILASMWSEGIEPPGKPIEALLAENIVSSRHAPTRRLGGKIFGNIAAMSRLHWRGVYWVLLNGEWDAHKDEFNGEWLELKYGTGLSTSPAIKKTIKLADVNVPTMPQTGGTAGASYELVAAPPGTILTPLSLTTTSQALMLPPGSLSQAVTALPISEVLTDGDIYVGDTVAIINPISGQWDELTVTDTSEAGDTSISVSGSITSNYPIGSTIFKKPKIGSLTVSIDLQADDTDIFSTDGGPIVNAAGVLTFALKEQGAGLVFAGPVTGADAVPTFRALVSGDINFGSASAGDVWYFDGTNWVAESADGDVSGPYNNLQIKANAVGTAEIANGAVTLSKIASTGAYVNAGIKWDGTAWVIAPVGTVTSVALIMPGIFTVSNSPITGGGTLSVALNAQAQKTVLIGPVSGANAIPTFRQILLSDFGQSGASVGQVASWNGTEWVPVTPAAGYTDEQAQDAVGGILTDSAEIDFTYNDGTPSITALLVATGVIAGTYTKVTVDAKGRVTSATTLSVSDIPNLPASIITSGILPIARGGTGLGSLGSALQLLRVNAAGTALEYFTLSTSGITGTLTATRIPYATGAATLADSVNLNWDNANGALIVGSGTQQGKINSLNGSTNNLNAFFANATDQGTLYNKLHNVFNTGGGGNVAFWALAGGTNAGDPFVLLQISGGASWSVGVDNSDSDTFKIVPYGSPSGGATGFMLTTTGEAAINTTPVTALRFVYASGKPIGIPSHTTAQRASGNANAHFGWNTDLNRLEAAGASAPYCKPIISYATPTVTVYAPLGTLGFFAFTEGSNNVAGRIRLTTGTGPTAGTIVKVTMNGNFGGVMFVQITAANADAAAQMTNFYITNASDTSFDIAVTTALAASTQYILYYRCDG